MPRTTTTTRQEGQEEFGNVGWMTPTGYFQPPIPQEYWEHLLAVQGLTDEQRQAMMGLLERQTAGQDWYLSFLNRLYTGAQEGTTRGLSPQAMAALKGEAVEAGAGYGLDARTKADLARRGIIGGGGTASGLYAPYLAAQQNQRAMLRAGLMRQATLADEQARQQNYLADIGALNLGLSQFNPMAAAGLANQMTGLRAGLLPPIMPGAFQFQQEQSGGRHTSQEGFQEVNQPFNWGPAIFGGLMGAAGAALGGPAFGAGGAFGCWIAEAIYGPNDYRTHAVRWWLNAVWARQSKLGAVVMYVYRRYGKRVARWVRQSPRLQMALKPLFDLALRKACQELNHRCAVSLRQVGAGYFRRWANDAYESFTSGVDQSRHGVGHFAR